MRRPLAARCRAACCSGAVGRRFVMAATIIARKTFKDGARGGTPWLLAEVTIIGFSITFEGIFAALTSCTVTYFEILLWKC